MERPPIDLLWTGAEQLGPIRTKGFPDLREFTRRVRWDIFNIARHTKFFNPDETSPHNLVNA
jgi:hypothetical protein